MLLLAYEKVKELEWAGWRECRGRRKVSIAKSNELGRAVERYAKLHVEPKLGGGWERKGWWGREERG